MSSGNNLVILLYTFFSLMASANDGFEFTKVEKCTDKRLDKPPEVSSKIPVQDQDTVGLCAAYANVQLIDAWRLKFDPPVENLTSPLSYGVQYAAKSGHQKLYDIPIATMLEMSSDLDSCSYNVVRDKFNSKSSNSFFEELMQHYNRVKQSPDKKNEVVRAISNCLVSAGLNQKVDVAKISQYLDENHWIGFTNKIMEDVCKDNKKPLKSLPEVVKKSSILYRNQTSAMNDFRSHINSRLDQANPLPIGIGYCNKVLKDRTFVGVSNDGKLNDSTCRGGSHASVVVGRRLLKYKDGNETKSICQFLVRNSYGSSCNGYDEFEADSIPMKPGSEKPRICESGQIWVDEDALLKNTSLVYHFKDK